MRGFVLFFILIVFPLRLTAFEIEDSLVLGQENAPTNIRIISTTDVVLFKPILQEFLAVNPSVKIEYVVTGTTELMRAISEEKAPFDIAISSAMDLQTKLANDGMTIPYVSATTNSLPDWAKWRSDVFAFTQEPAAIVLSNQAFEGLEIPKNREALIETLRSNPEQFRGRVGTYDLRHSGLGYLFATQDSRVSEAYWRLTEVMGALDAKLFRTSGKMIDKVASGELAVAYNVLGSYALSREDQERFTVILPSDFVTVMMRTAVIPLTAENPEDAKKFVDFLVAHAWLNSAESPVDALNTDLESVKNTLRRIRLGPGLLIFLDGYKRKRFISAWESSILRD